MPRNHDRESARQTQLSSFAERKKRLLHTIIAVRDLPFYGRDVTAEILTSFTYNVLMQDFFHVCNNENSCSRHQGAIPSALLQLNVHEDDTQTGSHVYHCSQLCKNGSIRTCMLSIGIYLTYSIAVMQFFIDSYFSGNLQKMTKNLR